MSNKTLTFYEFDEFRVDAEKKCLWHADQLVSLTPKAFETLLVLIKHRGEIVSKDVLLDEVWTDTFVEESTLSQNILTLRKTLGAFGKDRQFIVTVPRRGYRFVAPVKEIAADEEFFIVERRTRTHIVAERQEIHESNEAAESAAIVAEPAAVENHSKNYRFFGAALAVLLIFAAGVLTWRYFLKTTNYAETKFQKFKITSLVSDADIDGAVISPNGKYLALVKKSNGAESLIVRQIEEANSLEIVPRIKGRFIGASFAPESDYVFYSLYPQGKREGELYKIPILGGTPQQIVRDIDSPVAVSADQTKIAFIRRYPNEKETALIVADADGKNERKLAARPFGEGFQSASFSPDGKLISCAAFARSVEKPMELLLINAETGEQRSLTPRGWTWIGQTVWLSDASGIAFVAFSKETPNLTDEVWFVSYPEGKARLLENSINGVYGVSLTDDGNSLVTVQSNKITSFVVGSADDLSKTATILTKNGDESLLPLGADWTLDDSKIVYSTINNGNADLWTIDADGGAQKQLTSEPNADTSPKVTPDGSSVYFLSNRSGLMSIWRMKTDGTNPQKVTENKDVYSFDLSADGREIFYTARAESIYVQNLWKISVDGANARQLTDKPTFAARLAPDGKTIACYFPDAEGRNLKLTLLSAENGAVLKQIETPPSESLGLFDWTRDGQSLYFASRQNGAAELWRLPLDGRAAEKLKEWQSESLFRLSVSRDGKNLFYEKGVTTNNVLLLRDASAEK